jgi:hypothetical protein
VRKILDSTGNWLRALGRKTSDEFAAPRRRRARMVKEIGIDPLKTARSRRLMLQFRGCVVTSDAGLLAYRELDDALGLIEMEGETLADARTGRNGCHALVGLLRQSVFGRLAGYENVNDAERLRHDPAIRWIVGGTAAYSNAASPSYMGRFETQWLAAPANLSVVGDKAAWRTRRNGSRRPRTSLLLPTCLAPPLASCSTRIQA